MNDVYEDITRSVLCSYLTDNDINDVIFSIRSRYDELEKMKNNNCKSSKINKTTKKRKNNFDIDSQIRLYTDNEILKSALLDFFEMRVSIGKAIKTINAITRLFNKLDKLSNNNDNMKIEILERSILNNWSDVWGIGNNKICNVKANTKPSCFNDNDDELRGEELEKFILGKNDLDKF